MKHTWVLVIFFLFLLPAEVPAQENGTENVSMRQQLLKKQQARQKDDVVRDIKTTYRNISAAFKAGRENYGKEQVAHMEELLQREEVPLSFRRKMAAKLDGLKKRYGLAVEKTVVADSRYDKDALSPDEVRQVEQLFALEYQMDEAAGQAPADRRTELEKKYQARLEALYNEGVLFYRQEFYALAGEIFREIERIEPGYRDAGKFLESLEQDKGLRDEKFSASETRRRVIENLILHDEKKSQPSD